MTTEVSMPSTYSVYVPAIEYSVLRKVWLRMLMRWQGGP
jgi:hypothetical protein